MNALDKLAAMQRGESVVVSDAELDEIEREDWEIVKHLSTTPNPHRCGLLDKYIAQLRVAKCSDPGCENPATIGDTCGLHPHVTFKPIH